MAQFSLTSEVKLLYGPSIGSLLVLVVGNGGILEHEPVLFVWSQCQSFGPNSRQGKQKYFIFFACDDLRKVKT